MLNDKYILFYKQGQAVCPKCGGLVHTLKSSEIILHCIDCNTYFQIIGYGHAESELEGLEVHIGRKETEEYSDHVNK